MAVGDGSVLQQFSQNSRKHIQETLFKTFVKFIFTFKSRKSLIPRKRWPFLKQLTHFRKQFESLFISFEESVS